MAKSKKPGGGGRFQALAKKIESKGESKKEADAIAASAGRKKYGEKKMNDWSEAGKKH